MLMILSQYIYGLSLLFLNYPSWLRGIASLVESVGISIMPLLIFRFVWNIIHPLRSMESCKRRRVVRDSARFFNQPAGMLKNLYVRVESLENAVRSYPEVTELRVTRTVAAN